MYRCRDVVALPVPFIHRQFASRFVFSSWRDVSQVSACQAPHRIAPLAMASLRSSAASLGGKIHLMSQARNAFARRRTDVQPLRIAAFQLAFKQSFPARTISTGEHHLDKTPGYGHVRRSHHMHDRSPSFKVAQILYTGTIEIVNLHTSELLQRMYARDLFSLNITSRQERQRSRRVRRTPPAIVPRKGQVIVSFGNVRAIAGLDSVQLLDAHKPVVRDFAEHLAKVYAKGAVEAGLSNELIFLEEVLRDTVETYSRRLRLYEPIVDSFLDKVASEVYSDTGVHQLVPLKDSLQSFEIQVKQCVECLAELLNDDDEMLSLLLTEQASAATTGKEVEFARHEDVDLLLGVYARQLGNILMEIQYMLGRLQSKQEFVALALAGYRNRMVRMNVHLGIATLSLGLGTTVAGFFGMNLVSGFEESQTAFANVVLGSGLAGLLIASGSMNYLSGRTMQKRASERLDEIETLTGALSDMCAIDYTVKSTVEQGQILDKDTFRRILKKSRQDGHISNAEVDLLFDVFDRVKDGYIHLEEFYPPALDQSLDHGLGETSAPSKEPQISK